jgi:SNF family Na+-dependent transporter
VILGASLVIPAAFAFFGADAMASIAKGGVFNLGFVTMPLVLQKLAFGNLFGFAWFLLLFIAGITSSISLGQPAVGFLMDEFNLPRRKAVMIFMAVTFVLTQPAIFFLGRGVVDELDFWGGSFFLVLFATIETILFAWVFGMDRAWTELHVGSDITIPRFYRFIIKYVTPLFLLFILGFWLLEDWLPIMLLKGVSSANLPYVICTRLGLGLLLLALVIMVRQSWKQRKLKGEKYAA